MKHLTANKVCFIRSQNEMFDHEEIVHFPCAIKTTQNQQFWDIHLAKKLSKDGVKNKLNHDLPQRGTSPNMTRIS